MCALSFGVHMFWIALAGLPGPCLTLLFAFRTVVFKLGGHGVTGKKWGGRVTKKKMMNRIYVEKINTIEVSGSVCQSFVSLKSAIFIILFIIQEQFLCKLSFDSHLASERIVIHFLTVSIILNLLGWILIKFLTQMQDFYKGFFSIMR